MTLAGITAHTRARSAWLASSSRPPLPLSPSPSSRAAPRRPPPRRTTFSPGRGRCRRPVLPDARATAGTTCGHYDLDLSYDPATHWLAGTATITADGDPEPVPVRPRPQRHDRAARSRSNGVAAHLDPRPARSCRSRPRSRAAEGAGRSPSAVTYAGSPADHHGLADRLRRRLRLAVHATTARSSATSPTPRTPGSRPTTTRATRRRSRSGSPCRSGTAVVANGDLPSHDRRTAARRRTSGTRPARWRPTWPRSTSASGPSHTARRRAASRSLTAYDPALAATARRRARSSS